MSWFATPLGLLGLLAVPIVIALHLFRRRHQNHAVSALFLWEDAKTVETDGIRKQPLRKTPSFWLEILASLCAGLWLGGFDPMARGNAMNMTIVLDDTASMEALDSPNAPLGQQKAKGRALETIEALFKEHGRRLRTTIIKSGTRPSILIGPGALISDARDALKQWTPQAPTHDLMTALNLAEEFANNNKILLITDKSLTTEKNNVTVVSLGKPCDNFSLAEIRRFKVDDENSNKVRVAVQGFTRTLSGTTVKITSGKETLIEKKIQESDLLEKHVLEFEVPAKLGAIEIKLSDDALSVDNYAVLHPIPDKTVKVYFSLEGEVFRELGLANAEDIFPQIQRVSSIAEADIVFSHSPPPPPMWSVILPNKGQNFETFAGPFALEKRHPLINGITSDGLIWTRDADFSLMGTPLITAGNQPLISEQKQGATITWFMNLLPEKSTLQQSPDWPILFSNFIELRRSRLEGPKSLNLVAGESFIYQAEESAKWSLEGNATKRAFSSRGDIRIDDINPFGFWKISREGAVEATFSVNFVDALESDLRKRKSSNISFDIEDYAANEERYAESPFGRFLLFLCLIAIATDWWVLGRKA